MNARLIAVATVVAWSALSGCNHGGTYTPSQADISSQLSQMTTTSTTVPTVQPVAGLDPRYANLYTVCDHGHRVYVYNGSNQSGGVAVVDDPTCRGSAP